MRSGARPWIVVTTVVVLAACTGSGRSGQTAKSTRPGSTVAVAQKQPDTSTWEARTDAHGFTVKAPSGWTVNVADSHTAVTSSSADHALVVVRPFIDATSSTADQCVRAAPTSLSTFLPQATI